MRTVKDAPSPVRYVKDVKKFVEGSDARVLRPAVSDGDAGSDSPFPRKGVKTSRFQDVDCFVWGHSISA